MYDKFAVASDFAVISVTGDAAVYKSLKELVDAVFTSKAKGRPNGRVIAVALTPAASLLYQHGIYSDPFTIGSGVRKVFNTLNAFEVLLIKNAVAVEVELYYDTNP